MSSIISFLGADHKVGTTQMAQCCLQRLAALYPDKEFLLVLSDGGPGREYYPRVSESLDQIRPYIAQSILNVDELKGKAKCNSNMYIVGGNENPEFKDFYTPEIAELFLNTVKNHFDVILIDSGAEIGEGCTFGSLLSSDRIYLVLRQNESSIRRYEWLRTLYEKLNLNIERYILNCHYSASAYDLDYISERLLTDKALFLKVRDCHMGDKSEREGQSLISLKPPKMFIKDIDRIAKDIAEYAGI